MDPPPRQHFVGFSGMAWPDFEPIPRERRPSTSGHRTAKRKWSPKCTAVVTSGQQRIPPSRTADQGQSGQSRAVQAVARHRSPANAHWISPFSAACNAILCSHHNSPQAALHNSEQDHAEAQYRAELLLPWQKSRLTASKLTVTTNITYSADDLRRCRQSRCTKNWPERC